MSAGRTLLGPGSFYLNVLREQSVDEAGVILQHLVDIWMQRAISSPQTDQRHHFQWISHRSDADAACCRGKRRIVWLSVLSPSLHCTFRVGWSKISLSAQDGKLTWQSLILYRCSVISDSGHQTWRRFLFVPRPQNSELIAVSVSGPSPVLQLFMERWYPSFLSSSPLKMRSPILGLVLLSRCQLRVDTTPTRSSIHTVTNGRKSDGGHDRQIMRSLCLHDLALSLLLNR